jgi:hypothetical protein
LRVLPPALALLLALVLAACGGSSSPEEPSQDAAAGTTGGTGPAPEGSIQALLEEDPAEDSALIFGTSDYAVGPNRLSFLLVDSTGALVEAGPARVQVATGGLSAVPDSETTAELIPVGVPPEAGDFDAPTVYVAQVDLPDPGEYTILVEPEGAEIQGVGQIEVAGESAVPAVGEEAVPSDNPTVEDGFPADITTATPPDVELLQYSVEESLADGVPFVVTFATPKFCASRVCGPVVDIVDAVRRNVTGSDIRFIHIEIFEDNDPSRGFNTWTKEWNLPTEPWTFVVDGDGVIQARFEGLVTVQELEQTVRDTLL